jgi:hypothetical protein
MMFSQRKDGLRVSMSLVVVQVLMSKGTGMDLVTL